ncbi:MULTISPECIES: thioredoxin family protein [Cupriavidus]|jgi:glutaredoxin|uniref:thioredoxin family protein n=1 Tax=Cupriavidus TaxID=106589 RepID=UPI00049397C6|nr:MULTISPECIES: thioredoxin family protein [Cupriavidus]AOY97631.1 glutaredoxin [Cupriavidus sp. USMAA2-4]AVA33734.1 thioredoxin family protein [Cupriavidus metallidurans]AVA35843.1 thioredoxin family protein [Cupriavidus metallidurans]AVA37977.1 thioredoxin family protein [Cupriavidus metallidurans]KAB0594938.1 thioredoxin family protein [Cupriavidus pauculus]
MSIKVDIFFTPGCSQCERTHENLREIARAFGGQNVVWRDINLLDEVDYAVELGVLTPPAIAIDGELIFARLPSAAQLRQELERRLEQKQV